jgi:hypothetical protein
VGDDDDDPCSSLFNDACARRDAKTFCSSADMVAVSLPFAAAEEVVMLMEADES